MDLESQMVVSHVWVLGIEFRTLGQQPSLQSLIPSFAFRTLSYAPKGASFPQSSISLPLPSACLSF